VTGRGVVIETIDAHAAGEPLRIVTAGLPELPGATILERRRFMRERLDHLRRALIGEPRGHRDMYGCVLTPPVSPGADLGVIFLHNEGYSTMCGHGAIALVTALIEAGALPSSGARTAVNLDTPAGLVRATARVERDGRVREVSFLNVPSFVLHRDLRVEVPGFGAMTFDVAFGGAFYAIGPASQTRLSLSLENLRPLTDIAEAIKRAVNNSIDIEHPGDPDLGFLYGVILTGPPEDAAHHSRNLCVFADAEVDRSPTGTGVSARLAVHHARGEIALGERIVIESILGKASAFGGCVVETARVGPHAAVVPEVSGSATIVGRSTFIIDPGDELGRGFFL
jgi:trans-L-3-hydroxyproline dehydratase